MLEVPPHVVAWAEAQPDQRFPQRCRPSATKPGADDHKGRRRYAGRGWRWWIGLHHVVRQRSFTASGSAGQPRAPAALSTAAVVFEVALVQASAALAAYGCSVAADVAALQHSARAFA